MRMMERDYLHSSLCDCPVVRTGPGFSLFFVLKIII